MKITLISPRLAIQSGRKAEEVVAEIIFLRDKVSVQHFQIEDLNPTVDTKRMDELCRLLIEKNAGIFFYLVSGTKAETVKLDQLEKYYEAGCRYISISPESGSAHVMQNIGKPFNYDHGLQLVQRCKIVGIKTQTCFIVGHPAETEDDHKQSCSYLKKLIQAGLDEAAFFIVAPFAGSTLFLRQQMELSDEHAFVSLSHTSRKDWEQVNARRQELIRLFFFEKLKREPDILIHIFRSLFGIPAIKMENLPKRVAYVLWLTIKNKFNVGRKGISPHA